MDLARGIGIISVVIAHVLADTNPSNDITWFLFLFHMPMFFIIAGMNQKSASLRDIASRRASQLLVPYIFYLALFTLPSVARWAFELYRGRVDHPINWISVFWGGDQLSGSTGVLWFLTCLFFAQIAYAFLLNQFRSPRNPALISFIILGMICAYALSHYAISLPLALNIAPAALVFLWIGNIVGRRNIRPALAIAFVGVTIGILFFLIDTGYQTAFDMKNMAYGAIGFGILLAALLSFSVFGLSQTLAQTNLGNSLSYIGQASLTIMALHQGVRFPLQSVVGMNPVVLIAFAICVPLSIYAAIEKGRDFFQNKRNKRLTSALLHRDQK